MVPYDTMLFFYQYLCALLVPDILHVPPTRIPYLTSKYWHTVFDTKTLGPCKCTRSFALVSLCFVLWKICIVASVASGVVYPHRILLLTFVQFDAFMVNGLIKKNKKGLALVFLLSSHKCLCSRQPCLFEDPKEKTLLLGLTQNSFSSARYLSQVKQIGICNANALALDWQFNLPHSQQGFVLCGTTNEGVHLLLWQVQIFQANFGEKEIYSFISLYLCLQ